MIKKLTISGFLALSCAAQSFAADTQHAESSGGLPQLDPSSFGSQTFWLIIIFTGIYLFFSRKTLPEISQTVENRAERIKNDLDSAEVLKTEVASVQEAYETSLKKARKKSSLLFTEVEEIIRIKSEDKAKEFQEHASKKIKELEQNINKARDAAMDDMGQIAGDVAAEAAEKIIGVRADAKSVRAVVNSINKAA